MTIPVMKKLCFRATLILVITLNYGVSVKVSSNERQEIVADRKTLNACNSEINELCKFKPTEVVREQQCLKKKVSELTEQCRTIVEKELDRNRPITLPDSLRK